MRGRVRRRRPWLLITALGVAQVCVAAATAPEYRVKAAFIYKFTTYIRWPPSPRAVTAPFLIGVIGTDPFGPSLDEVVRDQTVQGRGMRIKALSRPEDTLGCDVVFVCASERTNLGAILALLRGAPVLTVSDMDDFAEEGGMIGLVTTKDNHVRFDINKEAMERAGLRASSQLLHLARIVVQTRHDRGNR
jgi:hypothetical protein